MSLDLMIGDSEFNYTYNLGKVWRRLYPEASGMVDIEGLTGLEALPILRKAIVAIENDYYSLLELNPSNGWGDLDSFYLWLGLLSLQCLKHPNDKWSAWR